MKRMPIILASGSAARKQMLTQAGLHFEVVPADVDEDHIREMAVALAEAKALAVAVKHPGATVIGADQILSFREQVWSKPGSRDGARKTLAALQGGTHQLFSAVALASGDRVAWRTVMTATLAMRSLSRHDVECYLDEVGDHIFGCVGAYQIEGPGIRLFERIEGDHFTIMGMPLLPLLGALRQIESVSA
jgi:septum formation protein